MNVQDTLQTLDGLFRRGEYDKVEPFMLEHLARAEAEGDKGSALSILNELMGYYRSQSRFRDALALGDKALGLLDAMGLKGSIHYATTLLNIATAYRADGQTRKAISLFEEVGQRFLALQVQDTYLVASLYNNLALAWQEAGDHAKAIAFLDAALPLIRTRQGGEVDVAVSLTNLALSRTRLGQLAESRAALQEALRLFESQTRISGHYSAALAAFAELNYKEGRLQEAVALYERALAEIVPRFGKNTQYAITLESLALALDRLDPARSAALLAEARQILHVEKAEPAAMSGLELARSYYQAVRGELLASFAPVAQRIAFGLVGHGSECFGFDDALSRDHDFGPGFCIWLTDEDYALFGARLQTEYAQLPREFAGFAARQVSPRSEQRVGVFRISDFYAQFLGAPNLPVSDADWLQIPEELLACACNGEVFADPLGEFSRLRAQLQAYYPDGIIRRKLAQAVAKMAQSGQYNLPRALQRGELVTAQLARAEFMRHACCAAFVLNRRYAPVYKWLHRGLRTLPKLGDLHGVLDALARAPIDASQELVAQICQTVLDELIAQDFSTAGDSFLETHVDTILGRKRSSPA
ncbi:DUF4037 domain-containing protein [Uliginosibacterium sediminicola]|uniref:DUF4037 domain-containing protein n=1 Tax=Uliginosibacterium sediminicola TaxID=2024550 RepID=A0ABU9YU29_9RHOO